MKLIVAVSKDWGIGFKGQLLFSLPDDMKFFKEMTTNKVVIMGRNTLMSLPGGKPLKNRVNIVMTRDKSFQREGCIICNSIEALLEEIKKYDSDDVFVIGGGKMYEDLYTYCSEALITKVDKVQEADTYLHNFDKDESWELVYTSKSHENNGIRFTFNTYRNLKVI
jgi:dihydrofolate reductase